MNHIVSVGLVIGKIMCTVFQVKRLEQIANGVEIDGKEKAHEAKSSSSVWKMRQK